jgi:hypothetical protein
MRWLLMGFGFFCFEKTTALLDSIEKVPLYLLSQKVLKMLPPPSPYSGELYERYVLEIGQTEEISVDCI